VTAIFATLFAPAMADGAAAPKALVIDAMFN
jgi:hypothetical protein